MPALRERAAAPVPITTASRPLPPPCPLPPLPPHTDRLPRLKPPNSTEPCSLAPKDARQTAKLSRLYVFLYPLMVTSHSFLFFTSSSDPCRSPKLPQEREIVSSWQHTWHKYSAQALRTHFFGRLTRKQCQEDEKLYENSKDEADGIPWTQFCVNLSAVETWKYTLSTFYRPFTFPCESD